MDFNQISIFDMPGISTFKQTIFDEIYPIGVEVHFTGDVPSFGSWVQNNDDPTLYTRYE